VIKPIESADYNSEKRLELDEPSLTRLTLNGLRPLHTYRLTLSCVNRRGAGVPVSVVASTLPPPSSSALSLYIHTFLLPLAYLLRLLYGRSRGRPVCITENPPL